MERIFFLLLFVLLPLVLAQSCQLLDDNPWPPITAVNTPTPLTLKYTFTVAGCSRATTETRRLTAYPPDGYPYYARPATLVSTGSGVSTATFAFPSLFVTMLYPGAEIALEYFPTTAYSPTEMSIATVPFTDATFTGPSLSAIAGTSTLATSSTVAIPPASSNSSSASDSSLASSSKNNNHNPAIVAGVIGGIAAVLVIGLLGWVAASSRYGHRRLSVIKEKSPITGSREPQIPI